VQHAKNIGSSLEAEPFPARLFGETPGPDRVKTEFADDAEVAGSAAAAGAADRSMAVRRREPDAEAGSPNHGARLAAAAAAADAAAAAAAEGAPSNLTKGASDDGERGAPAAAPAAR
jgi:hypothetical protein